MVWGPVWLPHAASSSIIIFNHVLTHPFHFPLWSLHENQLTGPSVKQHTSLPRQTSWAGRHGDRVGLTLSLVATSFVSVNRLPLATVPADLSRDLIAFQLIAPSVGTKLNQTEETFHEPPHKSDSSWHHNKVILNTHDSAHPGQLSKHVPAPKCSVCRARKGSRYLFFSLTICMCPPRWQTIYYVLLHTEAWIEAAFMYNLQGGLFPRWSHLGFAYQKQAGSQLKPFQRGSSAQPTWGILTLDPEQAVLPESTSTCSCSSTNWS